MHVDVKWQALASASLIVLMLTVVSSVSCRQVVGIDDVSPPPHCAIPSATPSTSSSSSSSSCSDCLIDRCCVELDTCNSDPVCTGTLACVLGCGAADERCREDCEKKKGLPESSAALFACQASHCDAACGLACGGAGVPFTGCKPCASSCCVESATFSSALDGQRLRACRARCKPSDATCLEACVNAHVEGADRERTALECVARACGFDGDWGCVGHVEPRHANTPALTINIITQNFDTLAPIAGVSLRGCSADNLTCDPVRFGTATTNPTGFGRLKVTLNPITGFDAYPGFIELTHPNYFPALIFFTPPLVHDTDIGVLLFSPDTLAQIEQASGAHVDTVSRGVIGFTALDCGGKPVAGVSVRVDKADAMTRTFYTRTASAGGSKFDFAAISTTSTGVGSIINVPTGNVEITVSVDGRCLSTAHTTVGVRAGAATLFNIPPLPSVP